MKKIILIGFMGAGKSTVASALSKKLRMPAVEMDELVKKKFDGLAVTEIFARFGEVLFREKEIEVAKSLMNKTDVIISTGGGAVMNKIIIDFLKTNGKVIFLETGFQTLSKRLAGDKSRPLFADLTKAKKLFDFRQALYRSYCDSSLKTDNKNIEEICDGIINLLEMS